MGSRPTGPYQLDLGPLTRIADDRRTVANVNYALYIAGFFTGITPFLGVVLAYMNRRRASRLVRSHLDWQIRIFWHCILAGIAIFALHAVIVAFGAITFGVGLVFLVIPWAIGAWWLIWTVWAIIRGLQRLGRGEAIRR